METWNWQTCLTPGWQWELACPASTPRNPRGPDDSCKPGVAPLLWWVPLTLWWARGHSQPSSPQSGTSYMKMAGYVELDTLQNLRTVSCCQHSLHFIINSEFKFSYWYTVCLAADTWMCCWLWWKQWWKKHFCLWVVWEHSCLGLVKAFMIQSRTIPLRVHLRTLQHVPSPEVRATHSVRRVQACRRLQRVWAVCSLQVQTVLPHSG